jgi:hypothetical protein
LRGFSGGGRSWGTGGINIAEFGADSNGFSLCCVVLCDDTIILGKDVNSDLIGLDLCDDFIGFYCLTHACKNIRKLLELTSYKGLDDTL